MDKLDKWSVQSFYNLSPCLCMKYHVMGMTILSLSTLFNLLEIIFCLFEGENRSANLIIFIENKQVFICKACFFSIKKIGFDTLKIIKVKVV